ncbi:iron chelate uptake ABC transporter family permease subunit [Brachybacterium sp. MASK1Z-5]|uniref:Iron chelate uptake ABC transporter family permease subunit n=1 Tax=Brachybacterium halotolerans TaxID=2795215 RepID=A0ABS1BAS0_9MICO|nr:iron chelate uptake ABC transporter family permease subunit [Brachybacterium halotolerans]MBK0331725.1 iron chelate uptake ABC transporter family permease subunit [Brachybacterium halotolerans]
MSTVPAPPAERDARRSELRPTRAPLPPGLRNVLLALVLAAIAVAAGAVTLARGDLGVGPSDILKVLEGGGDRRAEIILTRMRGPRVLVGAGAGAALGLAGTLFQTVTRNPLGSPDVIGLGAGAGAGIALVSLVSDGPAPTWMGALAGSAIAIGLVHAATGRGFASPSRLIIAGIGVAAMALALTQYVVAVVLRDAGSQLAGQLVGSLNSRSMQHAAMIGIVLLVCAPLAGLLRHDLTVMDMGDEMADALGAGAVRTRTSAIILSVLLCAGAVAVAGPIAFVALAAPHISRSTLRLPGPHLLVSALVGAVILLVSDLAVQAVPLLDGLPVGVTTAGFGGVYLGILLIGTWRRNSA